jgi:putative transcriptional regulator
LTNHVRALREARSMTQKDLSLQVGVSRQAINAIETGKYDPSIRLAFALARFFGKTVEELFLEEAE